ncbi:MAG TPA: peptidylprolyl isomerase [Allocoleopsis sp.]
MHYINNRKEFKRVAMSQILVRDLTDAFTIVHALREEKASFCALVIDYAQGRQARERGGVAGIHFLPALMPEIVQAIAHVPEGEIVEPIQTQMGYHIIKIEKRKSWILCFKTGCKDREAPESYRFQFSR